MTTENNVFVHCHLLSKQTSKASPQEEPEERCHVNCRFPRMWQPLVEQLSQHNSLPDWLTATSDWSKIPGLQHLKRDTECNIHEHLFGPAVLYSVVESHSHRAKFIEQKFHHFQETEWHFTFTESKSIFWPVFSFTYASPLMVIIPYVWWYGCLVTQSPLETSWPLLFFPRH